MTTIIILVVLAAVIISLGTVFGGPLLGVILAGAVIVGGLVWFFALAGSKTTTGEVRPRSARPGVSRARRPRRPQPLGRQEH